MGKIQTLALWHWRRLRLAWDKTRGKPGAGKSNGYSGSKVPQSEGHKGEKMEMKTNQEATERGLVGSAVVRIAEKVSVWERRE